MPISNTAFLLYRAPDEDFSDKKKLIETVVLEHGNQELCFSIRGPIKALEAVRIHLTPPIQENADIAYLKLYNVAAIMCSDAAEMNEAPLINLLGADELQQHAVLNGLTLSRKILGELYAVSAADPTIELTFSPAVSLDPDQSVQARVSLEYLFSAEYLLARDLFIVGQEQLEQKVHTLELELRRMQNAKRELDTYQRSPLWQVFIHLHHAVEKIKATGFLKALTRPLQPAWWSKRNQTDYETWRTSNGYETGKKSDG